MSDGVPLPLVGSSITMRALAARAGELQRDVTRPVMLVGARGLGKRYLAQRIHLASSLAAEPLVVLDARRAGDAEVHDTINGTVKGGALLVRHVESLSPAAQMLLDQRAGERTAISRLLATTTGDIVSLVTSGTFVESLYYRLYAWPMMLPPLAERNLEDLVALAEAVLQQTADTDDGLPVALDEDAKVTLRSHAWTENLRELEATLALAQLRARNAGVIGPAHLSMRADAAAPPPADASLADLERWHMLRALAHAKGNRTHAARTLGVSRMTLISKLKFFGHESAT